MRWGKRFGDSPVETRCRVLRARSDGWTAVGAMKGGMPVDLGRTALGETEEGSWWPLASRASQTLDRRHLSASGSGAERLPIIAVKSSVHFRADFADGRGDHRPLRPRPGALIIPSLPTASSGRVSN
jgi:microcystin degradation protein MlrC